MKAEHEVDPEKPFRFSDYPGISKPAEKIFNDLYKRIYSVIENAKSIERIRADMDTGQIILSAVGEKARHMPEYKPFFPDKKPDMTRAGIEKPPPNMPPGGSAGGTTSGGTPPGNTSPGAPSGQSPLTPRRFNLSARVWNLSGNFKDEIQRIIDTGIREGLSADNLSKRVRQYLNEPEKLFRRVRDAEGSLTLSRAAKDYHPGRGVYRSSYKNAMRLVRTETNMAYHGQAYMRWQQLDFIVGFRVVLSDEHPETDICDELEGEYPKEFK
ncbi:MAG: hypothetical protein LBK22_10005, partial [Tannerella sp.]|nr:hypothetical protein [Tannerella sp.]